MKRDHDRGARRFRVAYLLVMQGAIAVVLLALMWFQRDDRSAVLLNASFLVIPVVWAYALHDAWRRDEAARKEGRWGREFGQRERSRTMGIMGGALVAAVALAVVVRLVA